MCTKSDMKWSADMIAIFLNIYQQYGCLWDARTPGYLKKATRQIAMDNLICELEEAGFGTLTVELLKPKIKSIKDSYRIELNKVKKSLASGVDPEEAYRPKLSWFDAADCFLRRTMVNGVDTWVNYDMPLAVEMNDCTAGSATDAAPNGDVGVKEEETPEPASPLRIIKVGSLKMLSAQRLSVRHRRTLRTGLSTSRGDSSCGKHQFQHSVPDDEFERYGRHVAAQLRALPLRNFLVLQQQINNLITVERFALVDAEMGSESTIELSSNGTSQ